MRCFNCFGNEGIDQDSYIKRENLLVILCATCYDIHERYMSHKLVVKSTPKEPEVPKRGNGVAIVYIPKLTKE